MVFKAINKDIDCMWYACDSKAVFEIKRSDIYDFAYYCQKHLEKQKKDNYSHWGWDTLQEW